MSLKIDEIKSLKELEELKMSHARKIHEFHMKELQFVRATSMVTHENSKERSRIGSANMRRLHQAKIELEEFRNKRH